MSRGQTPEKPRSIDWRMVRLALVDWKVCACLWIHIILLICSARSTLALFVGLPGTALSHLWELSFPPSLKASCDGPAGRAAQADLTYARQRYTGFGYTNAQAQLYTVPPYVVGAAVLLTVIHISDRVQNRGFFIAGCTAIGATGYLILCVVDTSAIHTRYAATFLITIGTYPSIPMTASWLPYNMGSESKRANGIPMFMGLGQCGSLLGSYIYRSLDNNLPSGTNHCNAVLIRACANSNSRCAEVHTGVRCILRLTVPCQYLRARSFGE